MPARTHPPTTFVSKIRIRFRPVAAAAVGLSVAALVASGCTSTADRQQVEQPAAADILGSHAVHGQSTTPSARSASDTPSYSITSSTYTVKGDKQDGPHRASCSDGYYVRSGPPGFKGDPPKPAVSLSVSNGSSWVSVKSAPPTDSYGPGYESLALNRSFDLTVNSLTPYTHTYTFSWTCDAVPSWHGMTPPQGAASTPRHTLGDSPQNIWLNGLVNDGPGQLVMNNSGNTNSDHNPIIGWHDTGGVNQKWIMEPGATVNNLPTYSIWLNTPIVTRFAIGGNPDNLELRSTGGGVPANGSWYLLGGASGIQAPPGSPAGRSSVVLVNTATGKCLAGAAQEGDQLSGQPCDTNDPSQYWTLDNY